MRYVVAVLCALTGVGLSSTESSAQCIADAYSRLHCQGVPPNYGRGQPYSDGGYRQPSYGGYRQPSYGGGYGQPYYGGGQPYYGEPQYYKRRRPDVGAAIALGIVGAAAAAIASQQRYGHRKRVYRRRY